MAFNPDDTYIARDENGLFRVVTNGGDDDERNLNEAEAYDFVDNFCYGTGGTIHVFDPEYKKSPGLWETHFGSPEYHSYLSYLDQQAWDKGQA